MVGRLLLRLQIVFFAFSWHGRVPEGSRDRFKPPGDPPGQDFGRIFLKFVVGFHKHLQYFFFLLELTRDSKSTPETPCSHTKLLADSVGILSGFVGFRRDVAGIRIQPQ